MGRKRMGAKWRAIDDVYSALLYFKRASGAFKRQMHQKDPAGMERLWLLNEFAAGLDESITDDERATFETAIAAQRVLLGGAIPSGEQLNARQRAVNLLRTRRGERGSTDAMVKQP